MGLVVGAQLANLPMFFGGYPITPASAILHSLARYKEYGVTTFQAEDEIAAIASALGASYAGSLGVTSSSGPGIALKGEAMGLAIMTELPLVIVNSQRGGPSTGLPTKTEQSDLYQAVYGRNGDAPMPVLATRSAADCFDVAIEAVRIATQYMTPVMILTDGYIANAAEPWKVPDMSTYKPFPVTFHTEVPAEGEKFLPYARDAKLKRPWVKPGTPGLLHRIGGIEKAQGTGNIDYSPANHQAMTDIRKDKVDGIKVPDQIVELGASADADDAQLAQVDRVAVGEPQVALGVGVDRHRRRSEGVGAQVGRHRAGAQREGLAAVGALVEPAATTLGAGVDDPDEDAEQQCLQPPPAGRGECREHGERDVARRRLGLPEAFGGRGGEHGVVLLRRRRRRLSEEDSFGGSESEFRAHLALALREKRDAAVDALRRKYASKLDTIENSVATIQ